MDGLSSHTLTWETLPTSAQETREVRQSEIRLCARDRDSIGYDGQPWKECTSAVLPTNGTSYSAVCGRLIGYGYGDVSGFDTYSHRTRQGLPNSIEDYLCLV